MDMERPKSMEEVRELAAPTAPRGGVAGRAGGGLRVDWGLLRRFAYWRKGKAEKGLLKRYLE